MLLPSNIYTNYMSAGDTTSGLSGNLWSRLASGGTGPFGKRAVFIYDDFLVFGQSVAVSSNVGCYVSQAGQYKSFEGSSATVAQSEAAGSGGVVKLGLPASNNIISAICQGGAGTSAATSVLGALNVDSSPRLTIFETRFKVSSVVNDVMAIFIGLMEENGAVTACKADTTGVTIDNDFIGFDTIHYNSGTAVTSNPTVTPVTGQNAILRAVYKKDGQTLQVPLTGLQTMVADTWYKAGFIYDPAAPPSKRIKFFLDNAEQSTYCVYTASGTGTFDVNAATFPDGEELGFTAIAKTGGAGAASNLQIDWWAFYQECD